MLTVLSVLAVLAVLFVAAAVATREGPILADAPGDVADLGLPDGPLQAEDVQAVRFGLAVRGYRMAEVDAVLDRVVKELTDRDRKLAASSGKPDPAAVPVIPVTVKSASETPTSAPRAKPEPTEPEPTEPEPTEPEPTEPEPTEPELSQIPGQVTLEEATAEVEAADDSGAKGVPAKASTNDAKEELLPADKAAPSISVAVVPTEIAPVPAGSIRATTPSAAKGKVNGKGKNKSD